MSGFANFVVTAKGILWRLAMMSANFVAGVSGWQITKDGNAEFNDVTMRGELTAVGSSGAEIIIDPNNINPQITFTSPDRTNSAFINAVSNLGPDTADIGINGGIFDPGDGATRRFRMILRDSADIANFQCIIDSTQQNAGGFVQIESDSGNFGYWNQPAGKFYDIFFESGGGCTINAVTIYARPSSQFRTSVGIDYEMSGGVLETWHGLAYANGWADRGSGSVPGKYRLVAAPARCVQFVGILTPGTKTDGTVIATLPAGFGYLPSTGHTMPMQVITQPGVFSGATAPQFQLTPTGDIVCFGIGSTVTTVYVNGIIPLDA